MDKKTKREQLRILALTGKAAEKIVRKNVPKNVTIRVLPIDVAAFITKELIIQHLTKKEASNYDLILVPGFVKDDLTELKDFYDIPVVKGPRYANDIKFTVVENDPFVLSPKKSADFILKQRKIIDSRKILKEGFNCKAKLNEGEFYLGRSGEKNYPIGLHFPPLVMAEIVDATLLPIEDVLTRAKYYLNNSVDILDVGCSIKSVEPEKVKEIIYELKKLQKDYRFCLSIDSLNEKEIIAASDAGVDLVLSVDKGNIDLLINDLPKDLGLVLIPTNTKEGYMPKTAEEKVMNLLELKNRLIIAGFRKLFIDPIIEMPIYPGFIQSLEGYIHYRKKDPKTPMMTCVGNVTEFIEADPVGINALFGCIAAELGIQLLLATDVSVKCRGGVSEIVKARDLAYVSKVKQSPPKNHGVDILLAKSRIGTDITIDISEKVNVLELKSKDSELYSLDFELDPKGSFTIWIDYENQKIYTQHLENKTNNPTMLFVSSTAREILEEILEQKLISKMDHAIYLGRELERAEICLFLGKTYIQNEQAFKNQ